MIRRTREAIEAEIVQVESRVKALRAELDGTQPPSISLPTMFGETIEAHIGVDGNAYVRHSCPGSRGLYPATAHKLRDWLNYHFPVTS